jgi:hypothetical protein
MQRSAKRVQSFSTYKLKAIWNAVGTYSAKVQSKQPAKFETSTLKTYKRRTEPHDTQFVQRPFASYLHVLDTSLLSHLHSHN